MKMFELRLKFHWSLFLSVQLTISQHWFRLWLGADQAASHYLDQWWLDCRPIYMYASLDAILWSKIMHEFYDIHDIQLTSISRKMTSLSQRYKTKLVINRWYLGFALAKYFSVAGDIMLHATKFNISQNACKHYNYTVFCYHLNGHKV